MDKKTAAGIVAALTGGVVAGALVFGPSLAGAQTTTTTPGSSKTFKSNEDPAHEAKETPEQEAAEDSGQFHGGHGGHHGPNEDPAHEANETPEQEAQEHANGGPGPQGHPGPHGPRGPGNGSTTPTSVAGSATRSAIHRA